VAAVAGGVPDPDPDPESNPDPDPGPDRDPDYTAIRSVAVHREDVVTAFEASLRGDRRVVLRVTPPFSGRMRARLHEVTAGGAADGAVHVDPAALVADPPDYPEPDATGPDPGAPGGYDVERHRERHATAVDRWRERAGDRIVDRVRLRGDHGVHGVEVIVLG